MKLHFAKVSPTENMTVFIFDPLPRELHGPVARKIMAADSLHAEQVGFVEAPCTAKGRERAVARLQMMGGEFCGNATRALAAYFVENSHPGVEYYDDKAQVGIEVSGLEDLVQCEVKIGKKGEILSASSIMPAPISINEKAVQLSERRLPCVVVELPGIVHVLVGAADHEPTLFWEVKEALGIEAEAVGIDFYDPLSLKMTPIVWVKETGTLVRERGCGSGAVALGAFLAWKKAGSIEVPVCQPGGTINVAVNYEQGRWGEIRIAGEAKIVAEGMVWISA